MTALLNPLEQLQQNIYDRIDNDVAMVTVFVDQEKTGLTDEDLSNTLGSIKLKGTKKGAFVLVCAPFFDIDHPGAQGPEINPTLYVRCIERPAVNRGPGGTGISAEQLVLDVIRLLHNYVMYDIRVTTTAHKGDPIVWKDGEREYTATIKCILTLKPFPKCALPLITGDHTSLVLTCATPGAAIYYSTDGSYPAPGNDTSHLYAGPITTLAAGACVRVVAFNQPNQVASDLAFQVIT